MSWYIFKYSKWCSPQPELPATPITNGTWLPVFSGIVKIPETVIRFTKTTFRNRLLAIHDSEDENGNSLALTKLDETSDQPYHDRIELTEEEVRQMSDDWWTNNV